MGGFNLANIKKNRKNATFFVNPMLFYSGILYCFFMGLISFFVSIIENQYIFAFLYILLLIGFLMSAPRFCARITFNANNVVFKTAFSKAKGNTYESYRYIYKASYLHMLYRPQYIVFSQTRLSDYELQNINQIAPTEKTIKIRYSKKTFEALQQVLPDRQRITMEHCFK